MLREVLSEILREVLNLLAQGQAGGCCVSGDVGAMSLGMWVLCFLNVGAMSLGLWVLYFWECECCVSRNVGSVSPGMWLLCHQECGFCISGDVGAVSWVHGPVSLECGLHVSGNVGAVSPGIWELCLRECGHCVSGNAVWGTGSSGCPAPFVSFPLEGAFHIPIDNVLGTFRHRSDSGISMT